MTNLQLSLQTAKLAIPLAGGLVGILFGLEVIAALIGAK